MSEKTGTTFRNMWVQPTTAQGKAIRPGDRDPLTGKPTIPHHWTIGIDSVSYRQEVLRYNGVTLEYPTEELAGAALERFKKENRVWSDEVDKPAIVETPTGSSIVPKQVKQKHG